MIDEKQKEYIREQFEKASNEFDFGFVSPYYLNDHDDMSFWGYLFKDNLEKGVVIDIFYEADELDSEKRRYCAEHHIFYSCLSAEPLLGEYKRSYFREMLKDWKDAF